MNASDQHSQTGIVLRAVKYNDNNLIASIFTQAHGLHSYIARGVHSKSSKAKPNYFQPLTLVQFTTNNSTSHHTHNPAKVKIEGIKEVVHAKSYTLDFSFVKNAVALFLSELLVRTIRSAEPHDELFDFLVSSLQTLQDAQEGVANFHLVFMVNYCKHLGCLPHNNYSAEHCYFSIADGGFLATRPIHAHYLEADASARMHQLLNTDYESAKDLQLNVHARRELLAALVAYYQYHHLLDGPLTSVAVLEQL